MSKVLVTGINGFVGRHLARELTKRGHTVFGAGHVETEPADEIKDHVERYLQCDITNEEQVQQLPLKDIDTIINLAGLANVGASFDKPDLYMQLNVAVLSVLGRAFFEAKPEGRIIAISTGAVYRSDQAMPLTEESLAIEEGSPYALSKLKMEEAAADFVKNSQDCIVVRPFNHIGPGQIPGFLVPDLYEKLARFKETGEAVAVGNLSTIRDYTDVRDIATAYVNLVETDKLSHNLYNACSGKGVSGEEILRQMCDAMKIDYASVELNVNQALIRPNDPPKILGDHGRLTGDTGWNPSISIEKTLQDLVASKSA